MRKKIIVILVLGLFLVVTAYGQRTRKQKVAQAEVCGNPNIKCNADSSYFEAHDIPFKLPKNYAVYESKPFYAIILKSHSVKDIFGDENDCKVATTEAERLAAQKLFPKNKVFTMNCGYGVIYYTGVKGNTVFMAIYGGTTLAQARKFLSVVQDSGEFEGAYIKKMQAQFNGT